MKRIIGKLKSNAGESIAETLIALLISVFGMTLLAGMIQASTKLINSSKEKIEEYVEAEVELIGKNGTNDKGNVTLLDKDDNPIKFVKEHTQPIIEVYYYETELGNRTVVTFREK